MFFMYFRHLPSPFFQSKEDQQLKISGRSQSQMDCTLPVLKQSHLSTVKDTLTHVLLVFQSQPQYVHRTVPYMSPQCCLCNIQQRNAFLHLSLLFTTFSVQIIQRRWRDSNPRTFSHAYSFQDYRLQPLGHACM